MQRDNELATYAKKDKVDFLTKCIVGAWRLSKGGK